MLRLKIDPETGEGDLTEPDVGSDFETAAILSLACDASAQPDDPVRERRGYWADAYSPVPGDAWGCRLWELQEATDGDDDEALRRAEEYAREAFDWALEDGVASEVTAAGVRVADGRIAVDVVVATSEGVREFRVGV